MAYTLTQLRKDIDELIDVKLDELKNGFKSELVGEIKIQTAEAWDRISGVVETKITASNVANQNTFDRFKQEFSNKLEYFPSILQSLNELRSEMKEYSKRRENDLKTITQLATKANGWGPKIEDLDDRVNILEDTPGKRALKNTEKWKWFLLGLIPAILAALYGVGKLFKLL